MKGRFKSIAVVASLSGLLFLYTNCNGLGEINRTTYVNKSSKEGGTVVGNPATQKNLMFSSYMENPKTMARLCISEIKFAERKGEIGPESQKVFVGEVELTARGTEIAKAKLKDGTYEEVQIEIKAECGGDESVIVVNSGGSVTTNNELELEFEGNFKVTEGSTIVFNVGDLMSLLAVAEDSDDIEDAFKDFTGSITIP